MCGELSYKTHILIGVRSKGVMTVIADWPHVPKQADVERIIREALRRLRGLRAVYADVDPAGRRQRKHGGQAIRVFAGNLALSCRLEGSVRLWSGSR